MHILVATSLARLGQSQKETMKMVSWSLMVWKMVGIRVQGGTKMKGNKVGSRPG